MLKCPAGPPFLILFPANISLMKTRSYYYRCAFISGVALLTLAPVAAFGFEWKSILVLVSYALLTAVMLEQRPPGNKDWLVVIAIALVPFWVYTPLHLFAVID